MKKGTKEEYAKYRFQRAEETYNDALLMAEKGSWNSAINRLYYSCFYAVMALLIKNDIETKTHNGTKSQFGIHFIKNGIIDKSYNTLYTRLFDYRQKGDYGDLFDYDEETIKPLIEPVREFLDVIKKHL